jgi:hypothetical protein
MRLTPPSPPSPPLGPPPLPPLPPNRWHRSVDNQIRHDERREAHRNHNHTRGQGEGSWDSDSDSNFEGYSTSQPTQQMLGMGTVRTRAAGMYARRDDAVAGAIFFGGMAALALIAVFAPPSITGVRRMQHLRGDRLGRPLLPLAELNL